MKKIFLVYFLTFYQFAFCQECKKTIIYFKNDKHNLSKKSQYSLDSIVNSLDRDQRYLIELYGHTDDKHSEEYNRALGMQRVVNVKGYLEDKRKENFIWLQKSYGENKPLSDNGNRKSRKLNRRVEVFVVRLDSSGRFTIKGPDKASVFVSYNFFEHCGYCEANARLVTREKISDTIQRKVSEPYFVRIYTDCWAGNTCYEVAFRIPYEIFNSSAKVKVPIPLEFRVCSVLDSIEVNPQSKNYSVSYDTLRNEYILRIACFNPFYGACCAGVKWNCRPFRLEFPSRLKFHYLRYYVAPDSLEGKKDITSIDLCMEKPDIFSIGKIDDRYVHLTCSVDSLITGKFIDTSDLYNNHHIATIFEKYYIPFTYKETKLFLKIPKKIRPDTVGFYVNEYDYIIPVNEKFKRHYTTSILDYQHSIGVIHKGKKYVFPYEAVKKRYNKRKDRMKIKISNKFFSVRYNKIPSLNNPGKTVY